MTKTVLLLSAGIIIGLGASQASIQLFAAENTPYYEVAEINVKDQAGYEASGIDKVREAIKAAGGKVIAGGYQKAEVIVGGSELANRVLITVYPNKAASGDNWAKNIRPWPRNRINDSRSLMRNSARSSEKIVSRLDDEDLEHQHRVERWPPAFRPLRVAEHRI